MRITALCSILLVVACAGSTPTTTRHLLPSEAQRATSRLEPPVWIALNDVDVAPYLSDLEARGWAPGTPLPSCTGRY